MAQDTIPNWYKSFFRANVHKNAAQTKSRLESICEPIPSDKAEDGYYETVGNAKARRIQTRFAQIQFGSVDHGRRKLIKEDWAVELPVSERDLESVLMDPKSIYIQRAIESLNRTKDKIILQAAAGPVSIGRNGSTTLTAAADGVQTVNGTGGVTYTILNTLDKNWIDAEVGNEAPVRKILPVSGDEYVQLMGITQLTSGDYSRRMPVDTGIQYAMGYELVKFGANTDDPILPVSGGVRTAPVLTQDSVALWMARDIDVEVEKRTDLYKTWQIVVSMSIGAIRTEGALVQLLTTTD